MKSPLIETTTSARPEWIRMPRPGQNCPHSGLSRAYLYKLAADGRIKTLALRESGKKRGVRLVSYASLIGYLERLSTEASA